MCGESATGHEVFVGGSQDADVGFNGDERESEVGVALDVVGVPQEDTR